MKKRNVVTFRIHRDMLNMLERAILGCFILTIVASAAAGISIYRSVCYKGMLAKIDKRYEEVNVAEAEQVTDTVVREMSSTKNLVAVLSEEQVDLNNSSEELTNKVSTLEDQLAVAEKINVELINDNSLMYEDYEALKERLSLYEKYNFAVIDPDTNERTDLTYNQLKIIESSVDGIPGELAAAIIMTETRAKEDATSSTGTRGFGQIQASTGKMLFERMGRTDFSPDKLYDGDINVKCVCEYLNYLKTKNSSVYGILDNYRGVNNSKGYQKMVESFTKMAGKSLEDINAEIYGKQ